MSDTLQTGYYFLSFKNYKFGEEEYGQIMDNKPGRTIATEILTLYRAEMSSTSFAKQLKNNLDEILLKNISSIESSQELNI